MEESVEPMLDQETDGMILRGKDTSLAMSDLIVETFGMAYKMLRYEAGDVVRGKRRVHAAAANWWSFRRKDLVRLFVMIARA